MSVRYKFNIRNSIVDAIIRPCRAMSWQVASTPINVFLQSVGAVLHRDLVKVY